MTRNQLGSACAGSSPAEHEVFRGEYRVASLPKKRAGRTKKTLFDRPRHAGRPGSRAQPETRARNGSGNAAAPSRSRPAPPPAVDTRSCSPMVHSNTHGPLAVIGVPGSPPPASDAGARRRRVRLTLCGGDRSISRDWPRGHASPVTAGLAYTPRHDPLMSVLSGTRLPRVSKPRGLGP